MNTVSRKKIKIMLAITAVCAIAIGVFRTLLLLNYIEPDTGFYVRDTIMGDVFGGVMALLAIMILAFGFLTRKAKAPDYLDSHSMVVVFTSALCAFMYLSVFVYGAFTLVTGYAKINADVGVLASQGYAVSSMGFLYKLANAAPKITSNGILFAVQIVLCIPCLLNHISICSKEVREKNTAHALFAMSEALFFALRVVEVFMNTKAQINTSQRSLELLMLCAMMLFFLFEAGFLVKREQGEVSFSRYFMSGLAAVALPCIALIPYLTVSLFWPHYESACIVMDVLEGCVMLFAASRIMMLDSK